MPNTFWLWALIGLVIVIILGRIFRKPLQHMIRLLYHSILGGVLLLILNFPLSAFGLGVGLNGVTLLISGILGVPGVLMLYAIRAILNT